MKTGIVVHGSASLYGDREYIRKIHVDENGWDDVGYAVLILNGLNGYNDYINNDYNSEFDGKMVVGRDLDDDPFNFLGEVGAHALGLNSSTIGICMIGNPDIQHTDAQFNTLFYTLAYICNVHQIPVENVQGHYEVDPDRKVDPYCDMEVVRFHLSQNVITHKMHQDILEHLLERSGA